MQIKRPDFDSDYMVHTGYQLVVAGSANVQASFPGETEFSLSLICQAPAPVINVWHVCEYLKAVLQPVAIETAPNVRFSEQGRTVTAPDPNSALVFDVTFKFKSQEEAAFATTLLGFMQDSDPASAPKPGTLVLEAKKRQASRLQLV